MTSIDAIVQQELTVGEREVLADDRKRWKHMGAGAHLDEWLSYAPGQIIRRRLAMRIAFTNRPEGRGYVTAFGDLMKRDGFDIKDKTLMASLTAVLWLHDDGERLNALRQIRDAMTPGERSRLNSPISARQRVEKVLKAREGGTEEKLKTSPLVVAKKMIADRDRELAAMKAHIEELESADRDGSLFDLKRDSADDIGKVIVGNVGQTKAKRIAETILSALKAAKPAG